MSERKIPVAKQYHSLGEVLEEFGPSSSEYRTALHCFQMGAGSVFILPKRRTDLPGVPIADGVYRRPGKITTVRLPEFKKEWIN